ncbi:hypothetical protein V8E36_008470 [Tilletia maclaganii]
MWSETRAPIAGPSRITLDGNEDVTDVFRSACKALQPGQMVHVQGFTMMDSMGAIQIMDRRMDSGMAAPVQDIPADDRLGSRDAAQLPDFDPDADLSVDETCWIMDRLLACETCWQSGSALSQTIQTCLYVHYTDFLYTGHGEGNEDAPDTLTSTVLRAYLVAVLKCCCLAWDELSKGQVIDGEDWTGDKSGCSLLEDLDPADVLDLLEETAQSVRRREGCYASLTDANIEAIATRLQFRKHLLMSMILLSDPYLSMLGELQMHAHFIKTSTTTLMTDPPSTNAVPASPTQPQPRLSLRLPPRPIFMDTGRIAAPSTRVRLTFDPNISKKLTSVVPLRPISLPGRDEVRAFWLRWAEGLQTVLHFGNGLNVGLGWTHWQNSLRIRATQFQDNHPPPYLRSVLQSIICSQAHLVAGKYPPIWHAHAFLREIAGIDAQEISDAVAMQSHGLRPPPSSAGLPPQPGAPRVSWQVMAVRQKTLSQALDSFYGRLGGNLASYLSILCENRPRQKRSLAKAVKQWNNLAEEAQEIEKRLSEEVSLDIPSDVHYAAIQHLSLDIMLDILFSGFELELYRRDEWESLYWLAAEVGREQAQLCGEFADMMGGITSEGVGKTQALGFDDNVRTHVSSGSVGRASAGLLRHRGLQAQLLATMCTAQHLFLVIASRLASADPPSSTRHPAADANADLREDSSDAVRSAIFRRRLKWLEPPPRIGKKADLFWERFRERTAELEREETVTLIEQGIALFESVIHLVYRVSNASRTEARTELCEAPFRQSLLQLKDVASQNARSCQDLLAIARSAQVDESSSSGQRGVTTAIQQLSTPWTFERHRWFASPQAGGA